MITRTLYLDKLRVQARVGILEHEIEGSQPLFISIRVNLKTTSICPKEDEVRYVLDYRNLRDAALEEVASGHTNMLETLSGRIVQRLLDLPSVMQASVRIDKPSIFADCDSVAVETSAEKNDKP
jgi:7,8-dihydroneopterin aldolase/epimerase/oxygenase